MSTPRFAKDFSQGEVCHDFIDAQSGLRILVVRGFVSFCAYVGVRSEHVLAELPELEFRCHRGITLREWGRKTSPLQEGWFWWGWDYAHAGDHIELPDELAELLEALPSRKGHRWCLAEVVEDAFDVLMTLRQALQESAALSSLVLPSR